MSDRRLSVTNIVKCLAPHLPSMTMIRDNDNDNDHFEKGDDDDDNEKRETKTTAMTATTTTTTTTTNVVISCGETNRDLISRNLRNLPF